MVKAGELVLYMWFGGWYDGGYMQLKSWPKSSATFVSYFISS